jgi:hypothetical protein
MLPEAIAADALQIVDHKLVPAHDCIEKGDPKRAGASFRANRTTRHFGAIVERIVRFNLYVHGL